MSRKSDKIVLLALLKTICINPIFSFSNTLVAVFRAVYTRQKTWTERFLSRLFEKRDYPDFILQSVSLKLLGMPWIHFCFARRIHEKPYWKRSFLLTLLIYCCEFMYRSFLIYSWTLEESFSRQLWLAASLRK